MKLRNFRLRILDRYIIKKFIGTYFFMLLIIICITIIFDLSEKLDGFVKNEAPVKAIIFDYFLNFIPYFINMFSPMFVFVTVIFFTSKLATKSEIIAMLSGGISFSRLLVPYLISAAIIAMFSLALNLYVIPPANKNRLVFENKYVRQKDFARTKDFHYQLSPGKLLYIERFNRRTNTGYNFTLEEIESNRIVSKLTAETAVWDSLKGVWNLSDWFIREYDDINETITKGKQLDTLIDLTIDDLYLKSSSFQSMTQSELNKTIETQKIRGDDLIKYSLIEKNTRYAVPFSTFILTIMGLSLSSKKRRGGLGLNLGVGIALSFTYILFLRFSQMFVHTETLSPALALWLPNIIFGVITIFLYRIAPK